MCQVNDIWYFLAQVVRNESCHGGSDVSFPSVCSSCQTQVLDKTRDLISILTDRNQLSEAHMMQDNIYI